MSHQNERTRCAHEESRPGAEFGDFPQDGQRVEPHSDSTVREPAFSTPVPLTPERVPIERYDVLTVSHRDGSRQLWAECIERHRADAYAADLERILESAAPAAGEVDVVVELTGAILVRPWPQFSDELLLDEPDLDGEVGA